MKKNNVFTRTLAILGTLFAWFPILAPILVSVPISLRAHRLHFDYLMPAELFPVFLVGAGLLVWAAIRSRVRIKPIAWSLGITIALLLIGQGLAIVTGLASGAQEPTGWRLFVGIAFLVLFELGIITTATEGILLTRDLFRSRRSPLESK